MKHKIISYDLVAPDRDYESLIEKIKTYRGWARVTESCWLIKTKDSCADVRNCLMEVMDDDDRIFIAELTGSAAWQNVKCDSKRLKEKLKS